MRMQRQLSNAEREKIKQKQELVDAQDLAATLFESNTSQAQQILDLQDLVASLVEKGGAA